MADEFILPTVKVSSWGTYSSVMDDEDGKCGGMCSFRIVVAAANSTVRGCGGPNDGAMAGAITSTSNFGKNFLTGNGVELCKSSEPYNRGSCSAKKCNPTMNTQVCLTENEDYFVYLCAPPFPNAWSGVSPNDQTFEVLAAASVNTGPQPTTAAPTTAAPTTAAPNGNTTVAPGNTTVAPTGGTGSSQSAVASAASGLCVGSALVAAAAVAVFTSIVV